MTRSKTIPIHWVQVSHCHVSDTKPGKAKDAELHGPFWTLQEANSVALELLPHVNKKERLMDESVWWNERSEEEDRHHLTIEAWTNERTMKVAVGSKPMPIPPTLHPKPEQKKTQGQNNKRKAADAEPVVYNVKKILEHKGDTAEKLKYLVRWEGFAKKYDTWEPLKNLKSGAGKILHDYHKDKGLRVYTWMEKAAGAELLASKIEKEEETRGRKRLRSA